ncbi:hypothetical protein J5N97_017757 [Dioscorea zingiberensis]|uniref:Uncharacterized protein n=1 Tax=Dioscorea zingiberensis TaxID=325984 RepID=A0A9D5CNX8_9LILI|nr:hypothetical protein J5N97_017757 [Dioscorea zingiberensis]
MAASSNLHSDELQWVIYVRRALEEELEVSDDLPISISAVPKPLLSSKPECYVPQTIALGPYHHRRCELHEMERFKLSAAKRTQQWIPGSRFHNLVDLFIKLEYPIRANYHRYLDYNGQTLAWMMAIDASFLLEFLQDETLHRSVRDVMLRDVVMLENQIPLFLLRKLLEIRCSSSKIADETLCSILFGFLKKISPFEMVKSSACINALQHSHLLEVIYHSILPRTKDSTFDTTDGVHEKEEHGMNVNCSKLNSFICMFIDFISRRVSALAIIVIKFLVKIPWSIVTKFPLFMIVKQPLENLFSSHLDYQRSKANEASKESPPLVEEIAIPSVTELTGIGIIFEPMDGDLSLINFDTMTAKLHLPVINLDMNSEVVLRNLVAYEATVIQGPLVFTRYIEFMNGIIDTEEDARILREKRIVFNRLKSDGELADLWNGMSMSVKLTKAAEIDRVIEEVNKYYNSRLKVRMRRFMKRCLLCSWLPLACMTSLLVLLIVSLQAFYLIFGCVHHTFHSGKL